MISFVELIEIILVIAEINRDEIDNFNIDDLERVEVISVENKSY